MDDVHSNFNDDEDDAGQDEDDDNINTWKNIWTLTMIHWMTLLQTIMLMTKTFKFLELFVIHVQKMMILMA